MKAMASHVTTTIPVVAALLLVAQPVAAQLKAKGIEALTTSLTNAKVDLSNTNLLFDYGMTEPAEAAESWILTDAAKGGTTYLVVGNPLATEKAQPVGTRNEWTCGFRLLIKLANAKGKGVAVPSRQGYQTTLGTWNTDIRPALTALDSNACVYKPKAPKAEA